METGVKMGEQSPITALDSPADVSATGECWFNSCHPFPVLSIAVKQNIVHSETQSLKKKGILHCFCTPKQRTEINGFWVASVKYDLDCF